MRPATTPTCFLIPLLLDSSAGLVFMGAPLLLKSSYGLSDDRVGLVLGTASILYVVFSLLGGRTADRWGTRNAIVLGLFLVGLDSFWFVTARSLFSFVLASLFIPVGHAFFWPAFQAWIGHDVDRTETARRVGIFSVGWSFGLSAVGPFLGGWALEIDSRLPFLIAGLVVFAVLLFFLVAKPDLPRHEVHPTEVADEIIPPGERRRFLRAARLAVLGAVIAMVVLRTFLPLACLDWKMSEFSIGTLLAVLGVSQSGTFLLLTLTHRWHYNRGFLVSGQAAGMAGLLLLGGVGGFMLVDITESTPLLGMLIASPVLIAAGAMSAICYFSSSFYALFGEEKKGKNSGIHESIIGVSNVIAQYGGGAAVRFVNNMAPYWIAGLTLAVLLLLQRRVFRKE